ncbi:MAG: hypothetical protein ACXWZZ_07670 [Solirubrobacteraceae bacterium]
MERGLADGHVVVELEGRKLRGRYALTRTGMDGARERWILVKVRDEAAATPFPRSRSRCSAGARSRTSPPGGSDGLHERRRCCRVRERTASARQGRLGPLLAHPLVHQAAEVRDEALVLVGGVEPAHRVDEQGVELG